MTQQTPQRQPKHQDKDKALSLVVKPGKMERLDLGEYESEDLIPRFSFDYIPDRPECMSKVEIRTPMEDGSIRLTYKFQNYGDQTAMVFARELVRN